MIPATGLPCSLTIRTSVSVPEVTVTNTRPRGSTARALGAGVTVTAAGAGDGAGGAAATGRHLPRHRGSDALSAAPSTPVSTKTTARATRTRRLKVKASSPGSFDWASRLYASGIAMCPGTSDGKGPDHRSGPPPRPVAAVGRLPPTGWKVDPIQAGAPECDTEN